MVKLTRNYLGEKGPFYIANDCNKYIDWEFIVELHKLQTVKGLSLANKINTRHIHYQTEKMKVKPAVQVFSHSVFSALLFLHSQKDEHPQFSDAIPTAIFCKTINDIFDQLNTKSKLDPCPTRQPIYLGDLKALRGKIDFWSSYIKNLEIPTKFLQIYRSNLT